jgi:hypothetical protein
MIIIKGVKQNGDLFIASMIFKSKKELQNRQDWCCIDSFAERAHSKS